MFDTVGLCDAGKSPVFFSFSFLGSVAISNKVLT